MPDTITISKKELATLQTMAEQVLNITSRLKKERALIKAPAPRKGKALTRTQVAIERKNRRIYKNA